MQYLEYYNLLSTLVSAKDINNLSQAYIINTFLFRLHKDKTTNKFSLIAYECCSQSNKKQREIGVKRLLKNINTAIVSLNAKKMFRTKVYFGDTITIKIELLEILPEVIGCFRLYNFFGGKLFSYIERELKCKI